MPHVQVYLITSCPFCIATRELLETRGIDYEPIVLDDHPDRRAVTAGILPGHRTVPLIVIDGDPIGGYQELLALDRSGGLRRPPQS